MANNELPVYVSEAIQTLSSFCEQRKANEVERFDVDINTDNIEQEERITIDVIFKK